MTAIAEHAAHTVSEIDDESRPFPVVVPEDLWEAPAITFDDETDETEEWVMFVVAGLSFAAALAYAAYCTKKGGQPNISAGWNGFKVSCKK